MIELQSFTDKVWFKLTVRLCKPDIRRLNSRSLKMVSWIFTCKFHWTKLVELDFAIFQCRKWWYAGIENFESLRDDVISPMVSFEGLGNLL